jgi:glutamate/tyrosine decarboxylase-like PLP-dependent enzyme
MLGNLWGAKGEAAIGTATTGSSEAILLGGLAMKRRWYEKQKAKGTFPLLETVSNNQAKIHRSPTF